MPGVVFVLIFKLTSHYLTRLPTLNTRPGIKCLSITPGTSSRSWIADTGQTIPVEVFVSILPCNQLTYVEAVMSQREEDLIHACESALLFYGGTPAVIVPDNLKSAVNKPSRYEAELNEDFAAFAEHYGCVVIPARVRKPRDKALVEGAVKLVYRGIYTRLEGRVFHDLESLNAAIRVALELYNNSLLTGRSYSRREQY